ncbi:MAG: hypothetical protein J5639_09425 [Bacteroidales bacterium]|nr:hypothetical protein [Bacteroidales bacterium]
MKKILPDVLAIVAFVIISFVYFSPAVLQGRVLAGDDHVGMIGANQDVVDYRDATGVNSRWTNSIFSGMPNYQMAPSYQSQMPLKFLGKVYHLFLPTYVWYLFVLLLGFYIMLRVLGIPVLLSALGAVAWAFSSYFLVIIGAGHIWKVMVLAYIPPTIAGVLLTYKGKYLAGGLLTAFFGALQICGNHLQMTYYFLIVILLLAIAQAVLAVKAKEVPKFLKATGVLFIAAIIAIGVNISNLYHTYEYSKESMRNGSELVKADAENQTSDGLERDYITQWSYGIGETFSLLIPDVKGGASNIPLSSHKSAIRKVPANNRQYVAQFGSYWGEQPGTSGPVYAGAFIMFLFILGIFIVKGPVKWALVVATVLSILLSWGHNFMWFTNLFIDHMPLYSKFRTVASILVIAEFTIPFLAVLALKQIIDDPAILKKRKGAFWASAGLTGGLALLFAVMPRLFFPSYVSSSELSAISSLDEQSRLLFTGMLEDVRVAIFTADAWRSFAIIAIGVVILLLFKAGKLKANLTVALCAVLCLVDMWSVDKRYVNDSSFITPKALHKVAEKSTADEVILMDDDPDYRVLNLSVNVFNDNTTSYWHKSIGGYSAVKLRRYQEVIEEHITPEILDLYEEAGRTGGDLAVIPVEKLPVIDMLNTRYIIFPLSDGSAFPLENPNALGNGWFVDKVVTVDGANAELDALHGINPAEVAIVDKSFADAVGNGGAAGSVVLTDYAPNRLVYETDSDAPGTAVFSEVYYPTWQAFIDGNEVKVGRADYVLRALAVPAGHHKIEFVFDPLSLKITETIATISFIIMVLAALAIIGLEGRSYLKRRRTTNQA